MARPRRALVMSGGGAKGSFQVGVLEVLILERGIDFDIFCGVSVGSLNAAFLAQAEAPKPADEARSLANLQEVFRRLRAVWLEKITGNSAVFSKRFGGMAGIVSGSDSLYDSTPLKRLIASSIDPARLKSSGRDLRIQYVSLETGVIHAVGQVDPRILDHVLASSSMPFLFPPVEVLGEHLVDGGLRDITPLGQAFRAEPPPDEIYVLYASPFELARKELKDNWLGTKVNAFDFLGRTIEILSDEIYLNDVDGAKLLNRVKANWLKARTSVTDAAAKAEIDDALKRIRTATLVEVAPKKEIIANALDFAPEGIRRNYEYGRQYARERFPVL